MNRTLRLSLGSCAILLGAAASIQAQIPGVSVNSATESIYFKTVGGTLRGVEIVNITNSTGSAKLATIRVNAGGEAVDTTVVVPPGTADQAAFVKRVWPSPADVNATVTVSVGVQSQAIGPVSIGNRRPWTIHLAMDKHLDYMWQFPTEQATRDAMEALTEVYLTWIENDKAAGAFPLYEQTHFNFDQSLWWDAWTLERPAEVHRLTAAESSGHLGVGAQYAVLLTACLGTEEMIRSMYPARQLQREFGIDIDVAVPMETSSIPWGFATVNADANVPYLIKGTCGCAGQVNGGSALPAALFRWKGPDGKSVLMKWDDAFSGGQYFGGYAECYKLWADGNDLGGITAAQQNDILTVISHYDVKGTAYPVDQIMLYGLGWDAWTVGPSRLTNMIRAWNAQIAALGYEYPRLVNSRPGEFFEKVEASLASTGSQLMEFSGCFGVDWDVWMLYHSKLYRQARVAREKLVSAETLAAVATLFDSSQIPSQILAIREAYKKLMIVAEHTFANSESFGGTTFEAGPVAQLKKDCAAAVDSAASTILEQAVATVGAKVRTGGTLEGSTLLVLNPSQYPGSHVIDVPVPANTAYEVTDAVTGQVLPSQTFGAATPFTLRFIGHDIPGIGYKTFRVKAGGVTSGNPVVADAGAGTLENQFYKVSVGLGSGSIVSIKDKTRGNRELVSPGLGVPGVNAFRAKGSYPDIATVEAVNVGAASGSLKVSSNVNGRSCVATITLYDNVDRIDIQNDVTRPPVSDFTDEVTFDFPWKLGSVQHRYESGASITRPGYTTQTPPGDHLPGSTQAYFSAQHWVDTHGIDDLGQPGGVCVAAPDTYLFSLGDVNVWNNPLVSANRVNFIGYDNSPANSAVSLGDQNDETDFVWRFSVKGYLGNFDGPSDARFAYPQARGPVVKFLNPDQQGSLPGDRHAFLTLSDEDAVVSTFKVAEEGLVNGYLLRLWDSSLTGATPKAFVGSFAKGTAQATDLLERNLGSPGAYEGSVNMSVPARGFHTLRLTGAVENEAPTAAGIGPAQVAPGMLVTLDGSASVDPDDAPAYRWFQISGKRVNLSGVNSKIAQFVAPSVSNAAEGACIFQLIVDDGNHLPSTTSVAVTIGSDASPPSAPATPFATSSGQSVHLTWGPANDPESGVAGYKVYRAIGGGGFSLWKTLGNVNSFNDLGLFSNQSYTYKVSAVNGIGAEGPMSSMATATTGDDIPSAPSGLHAAADIGTVGLTWLPIPTADIAGYRVYRKESPGASYSLFADAGNVTAWLDTQVVNGTTYYYVVAAYDASMEGPPSAEVAATPTVPNLPSPNWLLTAAKSQLVSLTWPAVPAPGVTGYRIYRRTGASGAFTLIAQVGSSSTLDDYTPVNGTSYQYVVKAVGASGESGESPIASATPSSTVVSVFSIAVNVHDATSVADVVRVNGYSTGDPTLYVSNDSEGDSAGAIFPLPIPRGASITKATITVSAGPFQNPDPVGAMRIHVFDVGDCPPFVDGQPIDLLTHQPTWPVNIVWQPGTQWTPGSLHTTPTLQILVQHVVNRSDWVLGNRIGFVASAGSLGAGRYYGWSDSTAGSSTAPTLEVTWIDNSLPAPALTAGVLQVGQTGSATLTGCLPNDVWALYYAYGADTFSFAPYGNLLLDPLTAGELLTGSVGAGGIVNIPVAVPNNPFFANLTAYLQAITARVTPSLDFEFTNLVQRTINP